MKIKKIYNDFINMSYEDMVGHSTVIVIVIAIVALIAVLALLMDKDTDKPYNAAQEAHMRCIEEFRTASELAGCNSMYQAQKDIK